MEQTPIPENIKRLRAERHWSQEELAAASGVDARTIQRGEAGKPLSVESLRAIAAAFNTTIEQLSVSEAELLAWLEEFRKTHVIIDLQPVDRSADLFRHFSTEAYCVHRGPNLSEDQADAVAGLEQNVQDWGDIWADLEPMQRRDAEKSFDGELDQLTSLGLRVSAGVRQMLIKARDGGEPMRWRVLYVAVVAGGTPLPALIEEKNNRPISFQ